MATTLNGPWESGAKCDGIDHKDFDRDYLFSTYVDTTKFRLLDIFIEVEGGQRETASASISRKDIAGGAFRVTSTCKSGFTNDGKYVPDSIVKYRFIFSVAEI